MAYLAAYEAVNFWRGPWLACKQPLARARAPSYRTTLQGILCLFRVLAGSMWLYDAKLKLCTFCVVPRWRATSRIMRISMLGALNLKTTTIIT
eukprot:6037201-Pleurochrysis_carterae.AAC.1